MNDDDDLMTTVEAARRIKMTPRFVLDELRRKRLRGSKMGGEWRIAESDLKTYIDANANVRPVGRPP